MVKILSFNLIIKLLIYFIKSIIIFVFVFVFQGQQRIVFTMTFKAISILVRKIG